MPIRPNGMQNLNKAGLIFGIFGYLVWQRRNINWKFRVRHFGFFHLFGSTIFMQVPFGCYRTLITTRLGDKLNYGFIVYVFSSVAI